MKALGTNYFVLFARLRARIKYCVILVSLCLFLCTMNLGL